MLSRIVGVIFILIGLLTFIFCIKYGVLFIIVSLIIAGWGILMIYLTKKGEEIVEKEKIDEANRIEKIKLLESIYQSNLCGTNKSEALRSGRAYYSSLRKDDILTIYDEQAISNDLNSMK